MAQHAYSHIAFAECKPPAHARVASGKMTIRALTRTQNTFLPSSRNQTESIGGGKYPARCKSDSNVTVRMLPRRRSNRVRNLVAEGAEHNTRMRAVEGGKDSPLEARSSSSR